MAINLLNFCRTNMSRNPPFSLFLVLLITCINTINANPGIWFMYFGNHGIAKTKLRLHSEFQYRNKNLLLKPEQLLFRSALIYPLSTKNHTGIGYAYLNFYDTSEKLFEPDRKEHRIWQQFQRFDQFSKIKFEQRMRIEQRWLEEAFLHRARYRLMVSIPIIEKSTGKGNTSLQFYNELFLALKKNPFDRNRLFAGINIQLNPQNQIQIGYLHQKTVQSSFTYFQLALFNRN